MPRAFVIGWADMFTRCSSRQRWPQQMLVVDILLQEDSKVDSLAM